MELLTNEHLTIYVERETVFMKTNKIGFNITKLLNILQKNHPRIKVDNILDLKKSLEEANNEEIKIGTYKSLIEIDIPLDNMKAFITINENDEEFSNNKTEILSQVSELIKKSHIVYGVDLDVLYNSLKNNEKTLIAKGLPSKNGEDAIITIMQKDTSKPTIMEDGHIDHHEVNLYKSVNVRDLIAEKTPPTEGVYGKDIKGNPISPKRGQDIDVKYNDETVSLCKEGEKIVFRAKTKGIVEYKKDEINVLNHLHISGDVSYETGNISFDGFVTIEGTVQDGFSVQATKDITISSSIGVGAFDKIISTQGSISIKGGVFSKGTGVINANQNVYVKFANEADITAGEEITIGSYCYNTNINAGIIIGPAVLNWASVDGFPVGNQLILTFGSGFILYEGGREIKLRILNANQNVYVKFANEADITAGEEITIGSYCYNTNINAGRIVMNGSKGIAVGSTLKAKTSIILNQAGNESEVKTDLIVEGHNRANLITKLNYISNEQKHLLDQYKKTKEHLTIYEDNMGDKQLSNNVVYNKVKALLDSLTTKISKLNEEKQEISKTLSTNEEGVVKILNAIYPRTTIQIRDYKYTPKHKTIGTYRVKDNEIVNINS